MADIVLLVGGTGTQAGNTTVCGVCDKTAWANLDVSDIVGTNGSVINTPPGLSSMTYAETSATIAGDYSAIATILTSAGAGKLYAYLQTVVQSDPINTISGLFEIIAADVNGLTVSLTNLDGQTITEPTDGHPSQLVNVFIGGCLNSIVAADTMIVGNFGATLAHNVDVLDNLSETPGATTMAASSSLLKKIRYIGTVYDNTTANNNFADCGSDEDKFPIIDMGSNAFSNTGAFLEFTHITITGTSSSNVVNLALGSTMYQCAVHNAGNSASASQALQVASGAAAINCHVTTVRGEKETGYGAITNSRSLVIGCFVEAALGGGLYGTTNYGPAFFRNNIVIGGSSNTAGRGIVIAGFNNGGLADISNNIIAGFSCGAYIGSLSDLNKNLSVFMNNIFWGTDAEGSVGLFNNTYATKEATILLKNNFVGNFKTKSNFTYAADDIIELAANPFLNASGNMNVATDFYLNDTAGGGALVKANWQPLDYSLSGERNNFQCGTICELVTAGGSGGCFVQAGSGRFGVQES